MGYQKLLAEAESLKDKGRYDEACQTLRIAYQSADVGEEIDLYERLKLPAYLYLDGNNDGGWQELNRLSSIYTSDSEQSAIRYLMAEFRFKENKLPDSVFLRAWSEILSLRNLIGEIKAFHYDADSKSPNNVHKAKAVAYTSNGNPIFNIEHNFILHTLNGRLEIGVIESEFRDICRRLERPDLPPAIADKILEIIESEDETDEWVSDLHQFFRQQLMD